MSFLQTISESPNLRNIGIVILVVLLLTAGYFLYKRFKKPETNIVSEETSQEVEPTNQEVESADQEDEQGEDEEEVDDPEEEEE